MGCHHQETMYDLKWHYKSIIYRKQVIITLYLIRPIINMFYIYHRRLSTDYAYFVLRAWPGEWITASCGIWLQIKQDKNKTRGNRMATFTYLKGCHVEQVCLFLWPQGVRWEDFKNYMPAHFLEGILILTDISNRLGYCKWPLVMINISRLLLGKNMEKIPTSGG